jgi:hypothetical protein
VFGRKWRLPEHKSVHLDYIVATHRNGVPGLAPRQVLQGVPIEKVQAPGLDDHVADSTMLAALPAPDQGLQKILPTELLGVKLGG